MFSWGKRIRDLESKFGGRRSTTSGYRDEREEFYLGGPNVKDLKKQFDALVRHLNLVIEDDYNSSHGYVVTEKQKGGNKNG